MGMISDAVRAAGVAQAMFHDQVRRLREGHAVEVSQQDIDDAKAESNARKTKLGSFDGYRLGLEHTVDELTDQAKHLQEELDQYVGLLKIANGAEKPDADRIAELRTVAKQTMTELNGVKAKLESTNAELSAANEDYKEMTDQILEIDEFIAGAEKALAEDRRTLDRADIQNEAAEMKAEITSSGGKSAIARLRESAEARKKLVDERAGQARTARALAMKPADELRKKVRAQIANDAADADLDALLAQPAAEQK